MPVGSAQINFNSSKFDRTMDIKDARCTYGGSLSILFDGKIYPCCSQVIMYTGLYIGDFNKISLEEALYKAKNNALLYFLRNKKTDISRVDSAKRDKEKAKRLLKSYARHVGTQSSLETIRQDILANQ
jgi:hypothetical protein